MVYIYNTMTSPPQTAAPMPLDRLRPHQCAIVREIEGPDDDMERLMAMGVCAGRSVELVQTGDPLILKVFGSRIGLSARLAARVRVEPCAAAHPDLGCGPR
jgi:Fe2+ transport system protein FeoA